MPEKEKLARLRNIGIIAHIDAGKTTTTERILYHTGKTHKIGEVHEGKAVMDFDEQERERGITIQSAATTVYWKDHRINIIDTPGHLDFTGEVERSLRVLDGGVVILDGKEGVEAQTETVWQQATKYGIPRIIFVNKMDGVDRLEKFTEALEAIQKRLNAASLVIQFPIGVGKNLKGVVDVVEQKAYYFQMGEKDENYEVKEIPTELVPQAQEALRKLVEEVVEYDEKLFFKYSEGQALTTDEVKHLVRQATLSGVRFPVLCGSAYKHVGVKLVLEAIINYLPSPLDVGEIPVFSLQEKTKSGMVNWNSSLSCLALAFKIVFNERNERLTFLRVYVGKVSANSTLYNINQGVRERIGKKQLVRMHADKEEEIEAIEAGDIAVVKGLEHTVTGDTLGEEKNPLLLETIGFAKAFFTQAIEPAKESDQAKLKEALKRLKIQDPSFNYHTDQRTGQMLIEGMGKLHLEVSIEKLRGKAPNRLEIASKQPKIVYQETITKKLTKVEAWYKKKTGGRGHDARVWISFEPVVNNEIENFERILSEAEKKKEVRSLQERLKRWGIKLEELVLSNRDFEGEINRLKPKQLIELKEILDKVEKDAWEKRKRKYSVSNDFVDAKKGDTMSGKDAEEVKEGLTEAFSLGLLLNYPVIDVKATLHGGARHEVDTQEGDFKKAAKLAFRGDGTEERKKRVRDLGVVLLEPIMQIELVFPFDYKNDVESNLRSLSCEIKDSEKRGTLVYVRGEAPLRTMFNYSETLLKVTHGRGSCSMSFLKYEEVAPYVLQSILEEEKPSP